MELEALKEYIKDKTFVSYDTETNGVEKESHIIGLSICAEMGVAYYVILSYWDTAQSKLVDLETRSGIKDFIQLLVGKKLIMHNAVFDVWMTDNNFQINLMGSLDTDTMVLAHLLDENRPVGLKDLGVGIYGNDAKAEQAAMQASVTRNGGKLTKEHYELYKADADLLAYYGAKDALLTFKLFYHFIPQLYEQGLEEFFYDQECMPLLKGPTYELNTTGLRVDPHALQSLKTTLEAECLEAKAFIYQEITPLVAPEYTNTNKKNTFNIGSNQQLAWLLHFKLDNDFDLLTDGGKELCHEIGMKVPYTRQARRAFVSYVEANYGRVYKEACWDPKKKRMTAPKKIKRPWAYIQVGVKSIPPILIKRYKWVEKYYELAKAEKLLSTYVEGIQSKMKYNVIRPSFLQCGTTSGRYSSREPNFQNLPRKEKRIKGCIIARPGKTFVGADYSQLEPRVFASLSGDPALQDCFRSGDDFYSTVGAPVFNRHDCTLVKDDKDPNCFAVKYPSDRDNAKVLALAAPYGTTAPKMAAQLGRSMNEAQEIIDTYFEKFPAVHNWMLETHKEVKANGYVKNLYGRPRRMPAAKDIQKIYGNTKHASLPYEARKLLNLGVNHKCQSTGASIINRSAIRFLELVKEAALQDCHLVLNVHDELVVECRVEDAPRVAELLKYALEQTCVLKGVALEAKPVIASNLRDLK